MKLNRAERLAVDNPKSGGTCAAGMGPRSKQSRTCRPVLCFGAGVYPMRLFSTRMLLE